MDRAAGLVFRELAPRDKTNNQEQNKEKRGAGVISTVNNTNGRK